MSITRRSALGTLCLAAPAFAGLGPASHAATSPPDPATRARRYPGVDGKLLVNRARAHDIMERYGVDGLVALDPMNVYYVTNTIPLMTWFRMPNPAFAVLPRDVAKPPYLVTHLTQALDLANRRGRGEELPELVTFSSPTNWEDYVNASPQQMTVRPRVGNKANGDDPNTHGWAVNRDSRHTAIEERWIAAQRESFEAAAPTIAWAVVKALEESGLAKGTIGVDDERIATMLQRIGFTGVKFVPGANLFRRIRVIKSPVEIALMRIAGENNSVATERVIQGLQKGMTAEDIEQSFAVEAAKLGSTKVSFLPGMAIAGFPDGQAVEGKVFAIDAVSYFRQYHGDCGRTIVLGEPSAEVRQRVKAHRAGYDAVYSSVRAGLKFSDIRRIAADAMVKAGMPAATVIVNPHSVGLEHGDNPARDDLPFDMLEDLTLEENMVITVDLASLELGWGSLHHEDLIRITKTGFEPFPAVREPFVTV